MSTPMTEPSPYKGSTQHFRTGEIKQQPPPPQQPDFSQTAPVEYRRTAVLSPARLRQRAERVDFADPYMATQPMSASAPRLLSPSAENRWHTMPALPLSALDTAAAPVYYPASAGMAASAPMVEIVHPVSQLDYLEHAVQMQEFELARTNRFAALSNMQPPVLSPRTTLAMPAPDLTLRSLPTIDLSKVSNAQRCFVCTFAQLASCVDRLPSRMMTADTTRAPQSTPRTSILTSRGASFPTLWYAVMCLR
jgi:hypothetical protein